MFTTGLPLEPGEMGALIWMTWPTGLIFLMAETMPSVTVCSNPRGLPMTTTVSPGSGKA